MVRSRFRAENPALARTAAQRNHHINRTVVLNAVNHRLRPVVRRLIVALTLQSLIQPRRRLRVHRRAETFQQSLRSRRIVIVQCTHHRLPEKARTRSRQLRQRLLFAPTVKHGRLQHRLVQTPRVFVQRSIIAPVRRNPVAPVLHRRRIGFRLIRLKLLGQMRHRRPAQISLHCHKRLLQHPPLLVIAQARRNLLKPVAKSLAVLIRQSHPAVALQRPQPVLVEQTLFRVVAQFVREGRQLIARILCARLIDFLRNLQSKIRQLPADARCRRPESRSLTPSIRHIRRIKPRLRQRIRHNRKIILRRHPHFFQPPFRAYKP